MKSVTVAILGLMAATASGAGFSLYEGSPAGVADTAGAIAKGGSAGDQYYNPASTMATTGTVVQVGSFLIHPDLRIESVNPYTGEKTKSKPKSEYWPIPHAYLAHQLGENWRFGVALASRTGLGADWGRTWPGRYNSTKVEIESANISPSVAYRVNDWLTIAGGLTLQYFNIELQQNLDAAGIAGLRRYNDPSPSPYDVTQRLKGDDWAWGWDVGVQLHPVDRLHLGLAYHSQVDVEARGHSSYTVPAAVKAQYPMLFHGTKMSGEVSEPAYTMASVAYDFTDALTLGVAVTYSQWSSWDNLLISVHGQPPLPGHDKLESKKDWSDVWRFSVGGSYKLNDAWTLRASFTWDESPINDSYADYLVPADTREIYALGASYTTGAWTFDACYFFEHINDYTTKGRPADGFFNGKFTDGTAHAFAFSVAYQF